MLPAQTQSQPQPTSPITMGSSAYSGPLPHHPPPSLVTHGTSPLVSPSLISTPISPSLTYGPVSSSPTRTPTHLSLPLSRPAGCYPTPPLSPIRHPSLAPNHFHIFPLMDLGSSLVAGMAFVNLNTYSPFTLMLCVSSTSYPSVGPP